MNLLSTLDETAPDARLGGLIRASALLSAGLAHEEVSKKVSLLSSKEITVLARLLGIRKPGTGLRNGQRVSAPRNERIFEALKHSYPAQVAKSFGLSRQRVDQIINTHKHRARLALSAAVKSGGIVRPKCCNDCGGRGEIEAHHDDYSKPFAVKWLCRSCHASIPRPCRGYRENVIVDQTLRAA